MADTKTTALTGFTPVLTDIGYGVDDPGGTPISGKFTFQSVMDLFEANMTVPSSVSSAYLTSTILSSTSNGEGAALIGVEDAGTYFTGTNVEAVLAEIGAGYQLQPAEGAFVDGDKTKLDGIATGADAWGTAIDSSITVDTDSTYDLGTTAARIANGFFDQVYASGALVMTEVADNPVTPTAGIGQLWTSDDTTQKLMFTDDAGTDKEVAFVTGGTDLSAYTGVLGLNSGTAVDVNTKALLEARLSDVSDLAEADGDVYTGVHDFGGATSLEIPNSATPTVDAAGEIAIDTTVTDFSHGILKYFSGEEMAVVAMPIAELTTPTGGHVVAYNATNDEFELVAQAGGGDMSASTYDPATIAEQLVGLTATQTLTNKTLTSPTINTPSIGTSFTFDGVTFTGATGADVSVVSGTAGTNGNLAMWNADGDAVDSTVVAANVLVDGDIGTSVQAYDADTLKADTTDNLTVGFTASVDDDGTQSTGTYTPDPSTGNYKQITNGGAFTLAPPSPANDVAVSVSVLIINNGSAGAITTSGFTHVGPGDSFTTTDTHKFLCRIDVYDDGGTEYSVLQVVALQ